jgi:hypothetical protein
MKNVSASADSYRAATIGSGFIPSRDRKGVGPVEFYEQSR